jgi:hypothetical protein
MQRLIRAQYFPAARRSSARLEPYGFGRERVGIPPHSPPSLRERGMASRRGRNGGKRSGESQVLYELVDEPISFLAASFMC